ncbi:MAG: hypothetical protein QOK19_705 [Solirubrobacteraceae bacterium]|jgi:hypothetical protein|nr:hypothetical protein [Solirubrobacterales bacterium]MEA2215144.1 hypothetical protein [Solirubrobacteraceae bacterium]
MPRFEERLWAELVEQHGSLLADVPPRTVAPVRRHVRPRRRRLVPVAAVGLALAAGLAAIVIGLGSGGGTSAYAVLSNPDGTVSVTIKELVGVRGASETLASLGVPVRVVPSQRTCPTRPGQFKPARLTAEQSQRISTLAGPADTASVVITPSAIPAGDTVVIGARALSSAAGLGAVGLEIAVYEGAAPTCLRAAGGD